MPQGGDSCQLPGCVNVQRTLNPATSNAVPEMFTILCLLHSRSCVPGTPSHSLWQMLLDHQAAQPKSEGM